MNSCSFDYCFCRPPIKWIFSIGKVFINSWSPTAICFPISSVFNADQVYKVSTKFEVSTAFKWSKDMKNVNEYIIAYKWIRRTNRKARIVKSGKFLNEKRTIAGFDGDYQFLMSYLPQNSHSRDICMQNKLCQCRRSSDWSWSSSQSRAKRMANLYWILCASTIRLHCSMKRNNYLRSFLVQISFHLFSVEFSVLSILLITLLNLQK